MALIQARFSGLLKTVASLQSSFLLSEARRTISTTPALLRRRHPNTPIYRPNPWVLRKTRANYPQRLIEENQKFIAEKVAEKYGTPTFVGGVETFVSPLKDVPEVQPVQYKNGMRRTGVIAKKIGVHPMWLKDGRRILTTLLQVVDNHVIRYNPPGEFPMKTRRRKIIKLKNRLKYGALVVGAESVDPQGLTREYCGLFTAAGVAPKKKLTRFLISPEAVLPPGTPLDVNHYRIGQYVDCVGVTIDRGFQGVMRRWGFRGMPASHGSTKTHRRPGNIGGGGEKGRVWPGKKLPGHVGNRTRFLRGLKIWRINRKYNVLWVTGQAIPGACNSYIYVHDTFLPLRWPKEPANYPTYIPKPGEELPEEEFDSLVHRPDEDTITFAVTKEKEVRQTGAKTAKVRK